MVTKRQLTADLDAAKSEAYYASMRADNAQARLQSVLAIVMNGKDNLEALFGRLTDFGADDKDTYLRYAADDGLAQIQLNPATGEVFVQDPKNQVEGVKVTFDRNGDLDVNEQRSIQRFRADVMFLRQASNTAVTGKVSLKVRSARREDVPDPALAPVRES